MNQWQQPVEEFTTPNPVTATESTEIDELLRLMTENGFRHLPILRGPKVIGIVSERDLRLAVGLSEREKFLIQAKDIMIVDPVTVSCQDPLDKVAFEMSQKKIGSVIVNDENDEFMGIFTVTDALNALIEMARGGEN